MRFDLHLRRDVGDRVQALATRMGAWEHQARISPEDERNIRARVRGFSHCQRASPLAVAGVDGSGDFPALAYSDSFVYISVAAGALFVDDAVSGLREVPLGIPSIAEFTWLPGSQAAAAPLWDEAFAALAGLPVSEVVEQSDYRELKAIACGRTQRVATLVAKLLRPKASDAGNVGIQLRSSAEAGAALRIIESRHRLDYVLIDGTLSLPMVARDGDSLFQEHLKRLCAVRARQKGAALVAISKSHGLPGVEEIERIAGEVVGTGARDTEHWFLRLPGPREGWQLPLTDGRRIPPDGAVSYLARFHRTTPVLRIDIDAGFWSEHVEGAAGPGGNIEEERFFERLDYCTHDQRAFGYPYPVKAGHDRASLTEAERLALRKQVIDAAVASGMSRRLFRDPSIATGHG